MISEETYNNEMRHVDIDSIITKEGENPRKHRNEDSFKELKRSVEEKGVLQPICLRPHPEKTGFFQIAAGWGRFTAVKEMGGKHIPAIIRELSDVEVQEVSLIENVIREDMDAVQEGKAAKALLIKHGGDENEVRNVLGWNERKFKNRIQLTHATDVVALALTEKKIKLGHAELLSGLRESAQEGGLALVIKEKLSVEDLKLRIQQRSQQLKLAVFDTKDCAGCPHNTTAQQSLFESGYDSGRCLNPTCFSEKSSKAVELKRLELEEEYNIVKMSSSVAKDTETVVTAHGANGVGSEQFSACQGCSQFGGVISDQLGSFGKVTNNVCFNLKCHKEKVSTNKANLIATDATKPAPEMGAKQAGATQTKSAGGKQVEPKKAPAKAAAIPKKIISQNHAVHRASASKFVSKNSLYSKSLALISLLADTFNGAKAKDLKLSKPLDIPMSFGQKERGMLLDEMLKWDETEIDIITQEVVSQSLVFSEGNNSNNELKPENDTFGGLAVKLVKDNKLDLGDSFVMSSDYLEPHTKPVIAQLLASAGFDAFYEKKHGEKAFKKLVGEKKPDLIKKVAAETDFDWKGFVPNSMKLN